MVWPSAWRKSHNEVDTRFTAAEQRQINEETSSNSKAFGPAIEPGVKSAEQRKLSSEELLSAPLTTIPEWICNSCEDQQEAAFSAKPAYIYDQSTEEGCTFCGAVRVPNFQQTVIYTHHDSPSASTTDQQTVSSSKYRQHLKGWAGSIWGTPIISVAAIHPGAGSTSDNQGYGHQNNMSSSHDAAASRHPDEFISLHTPTNGSTSDQYASIQTDVPAAPTGSGADYDHSHGSSTRATPPRTPQKVKQASDTPSQSPQRPHQAIPEWNSVISVDGRQLADEEAAALIPFQPPAAIGSSSLNSSPQKNPGTPLPYTTNAVGAGGEGSENEPDVHPSVSRDLRMGRNDQGSNNMTTDQMPFHAPAIEPIRGTHSPGNADTNSYEPHTIHTAASVAAEARQFASALAASFPSFSVDDYDEETVIPMQPATPQQLESHHEASTPLHVAVGDSEEPEDLPAVNGQVAALNYDTFEDPQGPNQNEAQGTHEPAASPIKRALIRQEQRDALAKSWRLREEEAIAAAAAAEGAGHDADSPHAAAYHVDHSGEGFEDDDEEPWEAHEHHLHQDAALKAASLRLAMAAFDPDMPSYMRPTVNSVTRNSAQPEGGHGTRSRTSPTQGLGALLQPRNQAKTSPGGRSKSGIDQRYEPIRKAIPPEALGLESVLDTVNMPRSPATIEEVRKYSPAPKKIAPRVPGLDEVLIITKSKLELEKEACIAAAANQESPWSGRPVTPARGEDASAVAAANRIRAEREALATSHALLFAPIPKKPTVTDAHDGQGLEAVLKKHVSALDRTKIAAKAAGIGSPTARVHSSGSRLAARQKEEWGDMGLLELQKPHKSRLTREKEAWATAHGEVYQSPVRKLVHRDRKVHTPGAEPGAPSFMKDTCSSTQKHIDVEASAPRTP